MIQLSGFPTAPFKPPSVAVKSFKTNAQERKTHHGAMWHSLVLLKLSVFIERSSCNLFLDYCFHEESNELWMKRGILDAEEACHRFLFRSNFVQVAGYGYKFRDRLRHNPFVYATKKSIMDTSNQVCTPIHAFWFNHLRWTRETDRPGQLALVNWLSRRLQRWFV